MTREERNIKLKHFITCLKCEVSGKECDDNCSVQYEAGNMGEIIENLEAISKALEQEEGMEQNINDLSSVNLQPKIGHWISECDYGNVDLLNGRPHNYWPNCGTKMIDVLDTNIGNTSEISTGLESE